MNRAWIAGVLFVACSKTPPPKAPAAELEITGPASFAGSWVTDGELDWFYRLTVTADGGLLLTIDRGKMGSCEQRGRLQAAADPRSYQLTYDKNTCTPEAGGGPFELHVASFTGSSLAVAITVGGDEQRRTYTRDPRATPAP